MKLSFLAFHIQQSVTFPLRVFVAFFCAEMFKVGHVMFHIMNKKRTNPDLALSLFSSMVWSCFLFCSRERVVDDLDPRQNARLTLQSKRSSGQYSTKQPPNPKS